MLELLSKLALFPVLTDQFNGRASQGEFWRTFLPSWISVGILAALLSTILPQRFENFVGVACIVALTHFLFPVIARRLQDSGRSGHWMPTLAKLSALTVYPLTVCFFASMIGLDLVAKGAEGLSGILIAAPALALFYGVLSGFFISQPGPNKYGPNPHEVTP